MLTTIGLFSGHTWGADVLFLIAAIVFAVAAILPYVHRGGHDRRDALRPCRLRYLAGTGGALPPCRFGLLISCDPVLANVDLSGAPLAGAFIVGAVGATIAVIRLTKVIRDSERRDKDR